MKDIANFLFEMGQLKNIPRSGWLLLGINNPESVADHVCRSTFISFIIVFSIQIFILFSSTNNIYIISFNIVQKIYIYPSPFPSPASSLYSRNLHSFSNSREKYFMPPFIPLIERSRNERTTGKPLHLVIKPHRVTLCN